MQAPDLHYQPGLSPNATVRTALHHERVLGHRDTAAAVDPSSAHELNVSGVRVLLALGITIGLAGLFLWGFIRDWLFAP